MFRKVMGYKLYFDAPMSAAESLFSRIEEDTEGPEPNPEASNPKDACLLEMERLLGRVEALQADLSSLRGQSRGLCREFLLLNGSVDRSARQLEEVQVLGERLEDNYRQSHYLDRLLTFLRCSGHRIRLVPYELRRTGETTDQGESPV